jgi:glycerol-3-phosphate cytidylyltransferase
MRGFTCGTFDLFHAGHVLMLKEAREQCDYLIVGLQTDPSVNRASKNKPLQSVLERQTVLEACRYVDEVIVYDTEKDLENLLATLDIDIRILGSDHIEGYITGREICDRRGIQFYFNKREHNYSTSKLRERINDNSSKSA